ncbi:MAG: RidA family protein [Acidobacteria bacterium]|nr:RidA family protein [Acidobacteriota bacterium]MBV9146989.1 RidA family protein [Acidobacteriota bacterium]MBV9437652.1 RidA family protein [Acidobacteriota bacterium]
MIAEGKIVAIAGQIGWDPITEELVSADFVQQSRQALANVISSLEAAGGKPQNLVRLTWYLTDRTEYLSHLKELGAAYREEVGSYYPAMSVVIVAGLLEEGAKVEIEALAVL